MWEVVGSEGVGWEEVGLEEVGWEGKGGRGRVGGDGVSGSCALSKQFSPLTFQSPPKNTLPFWYLSN